MVNQCQHLKSSGDEFYHSNDSTAAASGASTTTNVALSSASRLSGSILPLSRTSCTIRYRAFTSSLAVFQLFGRVSDNHGIFMEQGEYAGTQHWEQNMQQSLLNHAIYIHRSVFQAPAFRPRSRKLAWEIIAIAPFDQSQSLAGPRINSSRSAFGPTNLMRLLRESVFGGL